MGAFLVSFQNEGPKHVLIFFSTAKADFFFRAKGGGESNAPKYATE